MANDRLTLAALNPNFTGKLGDVCEFAELAKRVAEKVLSRQIVVKFGATAHHPGRLPTAG